jgi:hypothetical protein
VLAIGLGLAYALVVEVLIFGLLGGLGGDIVKQIQQWFPVANTTYLTESSGQVGPRCAVAGALRRCHPRRADAAPVPRRVHGNLGVVFAMERHHGLTSWRARC